MSKLGRLRMARHHVESGSTIRATAEPFHASTTTVVRWERRYRAVLGEGRVPNRQGDACDLRWAARAARR